MSMLMCIQNLVRLCQFVREILSGNKIPTSIKGCNSVEILRKMMGSNPKLDHVNVDVHTNCLFVLEIQSGNKILTSIRGRNSIKILRKLTCNNPKLDLVNVDVHTKFGQILPICSRDIERKRNSDVNQGP